MARLLKHRLVYAVLCVTLLLSILVGSYVYAAGTAVTKTSFFFPCASGAYTHLYVRVVDLDTGYSFDFNSGAYSASTTWTNSVRAAVTGDTYDSVAGGFRFNLVRECGGENKVLLLYQASGTPSSTAAITDEPFDNKYKFNMSNGVVNNVVLYTE